MIGGGLRKRIVGGAVMCLTTAALVLISSVDALAGVNAAANWKKGTADGTAELSLQLAQTPGLGDITAIQVNIAITAPEADAVEEVEFTFDSGWNGVTIKEQVCDDSRGLLTLVLASDQEIMKTGEIRKLGKLTVKADRQRDNTGAIQAFVDMVEIVADDELIDVASAQGASVVLFPAKEAVSGGDDPQEEPGGDEPGEDDPGSSGGSGSESGSGGSSGGWYGGSGSSSGKGPGNGKGNGAVYQMPSELAMETPGSWEQLSGGKWKYKLSLGTYAKNTWVYVKGLWYHLGTDGIMDTGWYQEKGIWYFLRPDGHMKKGWLNEGGVWYFLRQEDGRMVTGWFYDGKYWYYMSGSGAMTTGWQTIDNKQYYFNVTEPVPAAVKNPQTGKTEYTTEGQRPLGAMYAGTTTPDGSQVDSVGVKK